MTLKSHRGDVCMSMDGGYPRVLLLTPSSFNTLSGGGITLTNLFRGWPRDRIAQVHSDSIPTDETVCSRFFHLTTGKTGEIHYPFPLASLTELARTGTEASPPVAADDQPIPPRPSFIRQLPRKGWRFLFGHEPPLRGRVTGRLHAWVRDFGPDLIYSHLSYLPYLQITRRLARELAIPMAIHIMDDWPSTIYRHAGLCGPYLRAETRVAFREILTEAALCMGICQAMCQAYQERYHRPFHSFHNALSIEEWLPHSKRDWSAHSPFRIVYAGSIEDRQVESLKEICLALYDLHASGMLVELRIHSPYFYIDRHRAWFEQYPCVRILAPPTQQDIADLFSQADLLVVAVNFDEESERYFRYSMPTKVPAYMISGTPVLFYGPSSIASVQYARQEDWGLTVTERSHSRLKDALRLLIDDLELRATLGTRARTLAQRNHDAVKVRAAFRSALAGAAARPPLAS